MPRQQLTREQNQQRIVNHGLIQTKLCTFFQRGHCNKGDSCNFFHPANETYISNRPVVSNAELVKQNGKNIPSGQNVQHPKYQKKIDQDSVNNHTEMMSNTHVNHSFLFFLPQWLTDNTVHDIQMVYGNGKLTGPKWRDNLCAIDCAFEFLSMIDEKKTIFSNLNFVSIFENSTFTKTEKRDRFVKLLCSLNNDLKSRISDHIGGSINKLTVAIILEEIIKKQSVLGFFLSDISYVCSICNHAEKNPSNYRDFIIYGDKYFKILESKNYSKLDFNLILALQLKQQRLLSNSCCFNKMHITNQITLPKHLIFSVTLNEIKISELEMIELNFEYNLNSIVLSDGQHFVFG